MSQIGTPTTNTGVNSGGAGVSLTKPSGLAVGDLLIAHITGKDTSGSNPTLTPVAPAGWTALLTASGMGNFNAHQSWYKIANSADVASATFEFQLTGGNRAAGGISRWTDVDSVMPVNASNQGTSSGTGLLSSGITPAVQSMYVMLVGTIVDVGGGRTTSGYAIATSNPAWTEAYDLQDGTSITGVSMAYAGGRSALTATGNASATSSGILNASNLQILALSPAVQRPAAFGSTFGFGEVKVPFVATAISMVSVVLEPVVSIFAAKWQNTSKNVSDWLNQDKTP